jgi:hypothetical protein
MSVKVCAESMLSTVEGTDMRRSWFPRIAAEVFLEATKDGAIKRAPDPVTTIDGDLTWFNNSDMEQAITVQVLRGPRSILAQSPSTVVLHDAWTWAVGVSPTADYPSVHQDTFGGGAQIDPSSVASADLQYGRFFYDTDTSSEWVTIGIVPPRQVLHFRYLAAVQTPGIWTAPSEFTPRWEAQARWTRLIAFAGPVGSS